ncbi:MAG: hypothetical protein ACRDG7_19635, partial [Candidatus Limnocylindria bacterium]
ARATRAERRTRTREALLESAARGLSRYGYKAAAGRARLALGGVSLADPQRDTRSRSATS